MALAASAARPPELSTTAGDRRAPPTTPPFPSLDGLLHLLDRLSMLTHTLRHITGIRLNPLRTRVLSRKRDFGR